MSNLFCLHVFFRPPTGTRKPFVGESPCALSEEGTREPFGGKSPHALSAERSGSRSAGRARMPRRGKGRGSRSAEEEPACLVRGRDAGAVRRGKSPHALSAEVTREPFGGRKARASCRGKGRRSRSAGKNLRALSGEEKREPFGGRRARTPCRGKQRGARTQIGTERADNGGARQRGKGSPYIHYIYCVEGQIGYHICGTGKKTAKSVKKITNFREKVRSNI